MSTSVSPLSSLDGSLGTTGSGSSTSGTGLGQGINVQQFVQLALASQTAAITALQTQQTTLGTQIGEIATINSELASLQNAAAALNDPLGALNSEVATSSNPNALTANAAGTASAGAHTISVANLATTSSYYSDEAPTSSTPLATGDTIAITVGSSIVPVASVTTSATDNTLEQIAAAINLQTTAVQASVITDANGSRLALVSTTSGLPGVIATTGSLHLASTGNTALNFHQAAAGLNASLTVDGVPVSSATNTVSGAINGVTLNLAAPTLVNGVDTPISLTVAPDTTQASTAVKNFVTAYNTVLSEVNGQFKVGSDGTASAALAGDGTLQGAQSLLLGAASYSVTGNNGLVNLASIGVNTNNDGTLSVDSSALSTALATNFSSVQNLLQNSTTGFAQNLSSVINNLSAPGNGILTTDSQSISGAAQALGQRVTDLQASLAVQEKTLTDTYSQVNITLQELPLLENQLTQEISGIA